MNSLLVEALDYYNNLNELKNIKAINETHNLLPLCISTENNIVTKYIYNVIGVYDKDNMTFYWAWNINDNFLSNKHKITNNLVTYAIDMEIKTLGDIYFKKLLLSNKINIKSVFMLNECISIALYLMKATAYSIENNNNYEIYASMHPIIDL